MPRARALLNRIVCVNFCSPSKHSCILLTLPRTNYGRLVKPKHDQTSSCQFPEFSNTLARRYLHSTCDQNQNYVDDEVDYAYY